MDVLARYPVSGTRGSPNHDRVHLGMAPTQRREGRGTIRCRDSAVPAVVPRPCDQPVADGRPIPLHVVGSGVLAEYASLLVGRHAGYVTDHPHVLRVVLLGLPRKGPS